MASPHLTVLRNQAPPGVELSVPEGLSEQEGETAGNL